MAKKVVKPAKVAKCELRKSDYSKVVLTEFGVPAALVDAVKLLATACEVLEANGCYREADHILAAAKRLGKIGERATKRFERAHEGIDKSKERLAKLIKKLRAAGIDPLEFVK